MAENDRWNTHLEYFRVAIALATALIAAAAAIYVDASKIPVDSSRYFLLVGVAIFFITLISSVWGVAALGNYLIHFPATMPTDQQQLRALTRRASWVTFWGNISFGSLVLGSAALALFFGMRTVEVAEAPFNRAIATAGTANASLLNSSKGEAATLKSIELQGNSYQMIFQVTPATGTSTISVMTDASGTKLTSARRQ